MDDIYIYSWSFLSLCSSIRMLFFYLLILGSAYGLEEFCTETNCHLPSCQCSVINNNPTSLDTADLPQLIMLTFVGKLNSNALDPIRSILNASHQNPNICPITATFFVNSAETEYCLVQRLFDNHHEIAMTTSSNKCPLTNCDDESHWRRWTRNDWGREINEQRVNIIRQAQIHQAHIKGFRAPHLQIDQNIHLDYLRKFRFHYDSSMVFKSSRLAWPFTLNYPFKQRHCTNCPPWTQPFDALWQFPLHEWSYPNTTSSCRTLANASCLPTDQTHSTDMIYQLLIHNFERHSSESFGSRSPWIIELDFAWLSQPRNPRLAALLRFIQFILHSPHHRHVYFVSIEKALEWMKFPRALADLRHFWAFTCSDTSQRYSTDCSHQGDDDDAHAGVESAQSLLANNQTNGSDAVPIDRQSEKLFRSGIALHALWISVVLVVSVLFYDKYFGKK